MLKTIKRNLFPTIIALSAISVSASAAFYSVFGLSKLFAGASTSVIIMTASLEVAKLVIASLLYQYWDTINKILRTYLTIATVILILITSMGIYGFLSAAYQDTYQKLLVSENQIEFLENKAKFYEDDLTRYDKELEQILVNISTLSNARSTSIQVRDTSVAGGVRNTISTVDLRAAQNRLTIEEDNRKNVNIKREVAADSLQNIKLKILALQNDTETIGELGPLKYIQGLTGTPMDKIINWLLLIIIFVFDPLAVSLVVAANFAFAQANQKNLYGEYDEELPKPKKEEEDISDLSVAEQTLLQDRPQDVIDPVEEYTEEAEKRMDVIGQNGNEGTHYEQDLKRNVTKILQKSPTRNRVLFEDGEQGWVEKDDNTIRYL